MSAEPARDAAIAPPEAERRQEERLALALPIQVFGIDAHKRFFVELTQTLEISRCGCRMPLKANVGADTVLAIRMLNRRTGAADAGLPLLYRVCWSRGWNSQRTIGARSVHNDSLWLAAFSNTSGPS